MKIALAQMKVIAGSLDENLSTMHGMINDAKRNNVELIVFPEMCSQGYLVGDKWLLDEFCRTAKDVLSEMLLASHGIAIAWGSVYLDEDIEDRMQKRGHYTNKDGRTRRYNAIYVVQNGKLVKRLGQEDDVTTSLLPEGVQPKTLLPNYRIFDDKRYFFSLNDIARDSGVPLERLVRPFLVQDRSGEYIPILFQICEDMWAADYREAGEPVNITNIGIQNGAKIVVNLSASPWTHGKNNARDRRVKYLQQVRSEVAASFFYVNCVGVQNNGKNFVTFDGGSTVYNRFGDIVDMASTPYEQTLLIIDSHTINNHKTTARVKNSPIAEKYMAIVQAIRSLRDIQGRGENPKFVIGLSGGIDSAVVCALLVLAVGRENVIAINMPSRWNSTATKDAAVSVANALDVNYYQVPITEMVSSVEVALENHVLAQRHHQLNPLTRENIQAKVRGTNVLSNIAGNEGYLFTNNGNKLEIALGYATLYGDVGGSIAPIGDLLKTEVFDLARFLNNKIFHRDVIPSVLLPDELYQFSDEKILPSAELQENQMDPMKFGYHDALLNLVTHYQKWGEERILQSFREGTLHRSLGVALGRSASYGLALMRRWGVDRADQFKSDLAWFVGSIEKNVFKRVQAPGIVITSRSAFGFDIRESMLPYRPSKVVLELREGLTNYTPRDD